MKQILMRALFTMSLGLTVATTATAASALAGRFQALPLTRCGVDAVVAGTVCLDRYEESVWRVTDPTTTNATLVRRIQHGMATRIELLAAGATQLGTVGDDYAPCADNGQSCANDIYAVSLPSEIPSAFVTWFQAQEACANSGKRLPTNAEWQVGVSGTTDPVSDNGTTDCNTATNAVSLTGSRSTCVSPRGAFDMVGNLDEWVADWVPLSTSCPNWGSFSDDFMCLAGADMAGNGPGALMRGGHFFHGRKAGPLTVFGTLEPSQSNELVGFRCAR